MSAPPADHRPGCCAARCGLRGAFAFAFSLVPLYRIACEKVFGIRSTQAAGSRGRRAGWTRAAR
jgi:cytochrome c oxidase assembly protein Cox11